MDNIYKKLIKLINFIVVFMIGFILIIILWFALRPIYFLSKIHEGMEEVSVISALGEPTLSNSNQGNICRNEILKPVNCKKFIDSGSKRILYWKVGIDGWIAIGFDGAGKVRFKLATDS